MKYLLGVDIGSSSVKCSLVEIETGNCVGNAFSPSSEMRIASPKMGFAEQDPLMWWDELINAMRIMKNEFRFSKSEVAAIGISYQMHGLVAVDRNGTPIIPSIIWCDGRAVEIGKKTFDEMGAEYCLSHYLNSPGNLTASKLKWVKENDPASYARIHKIMLPGDFIAYKMTGEMRTTISGLSEGVMWDVQAEALSTELLNYYGIDQHLICNIVPQFGEQGFLHAEAAALLGLQENTPVTYRAGDQPNNAFSLNVLKPGEIAATAGTSGVVYGVIDTPSYDPLSRVNTFVHVNHTPEEKRYGVLLCINGTGILNSWLQKNTFNGLGYPEINKIASSVPIGSDGLQCYPFGNGAERVLENRDPGAMIKNLHFNRHDKAHLARAAQEGIAFSLYYGIEIMVAMGLKIGTIRAGNANMFLSELFSEAFSNTSGAKVELYNTDGAQGAARAAGFGAGFYKTANDCFNGLSIVKKIEPQHQVQEHYKEAYGKWKDGLGKELYL